MSASAVKTKPGLLTWLVGSAAALALLLLALAVTVDDGQGGEQQGTAADPWQPLAAPPAAGDVALATAGGRLLAVTNSEVRTLEGSGRGHWSDAVPLPGPPRSGAAVVATPDALIVWGGRAGGVLRNDGYAYVPGAADWQPLPTSPLSARQGARGVRAGREVVFLGGGVDSASTQVETAAYDPASRTWRRLGDANALDRSVIMATAWTGEQVVVWAYQQSTAEHDLLAVDPDTELAQWTPLAPPPFAPPVGGAGLASDQAGLVATATGGRPAQAAVVPWRAPLGSVAEWQPLPSPPAPAVVCPSELEDGGAGAVLVVQCTDEMFLLERGDNPTWRRLPPPEPGAPDAGPGQALVTGDAVYYLAPGTDGTAPSLVRLPLG